MKKSKYDFYNKNELQEIIDNSNSIKEVIEKIGLNANGSGGYKNFHRKVLKYNLNIEDIKIRRYKNCFKNRKNKTDLKNILIENYQGGINSSKIKKKLFENQLKTNICESCGQLPEWNKKPLILQLDHINGKNNDNRIENLRILCPNCHTQTETWGNKQLKKKQNYCIGCKKEISKKAIMCLPCANKKTGKNLRKLDINKTELKTFLDKNIKYTQLAEIFNVSDVTIRNYAKKFSLV